MNCQGKRDLQERMIVKTAGVKMMMECEEIVQMTQAICAQAQMNQTQLKSFPNQLPAAVPQVVLHIHWQKFETVDFTTGSSKEQEV